MNIDLSPRGLRKHEAFAADHLAPLVLEYASANGLSKEDAVIALFLSLANVMVVPTRDLAWAVGIGRDVLADHGTSQ